MSTNKILILQSVGITLQMINASIATSLHNSTISLVIGAVVGGYQFYVQHVGNQTNPNPDAAALKKSAGGS